MNDTNERSAASRGPAGHTPDASRLPDFAKGWVKIKPDTVFYDGEQWLMAVPVRNRWAPGKWNYEFSVVKMCCDEEHFAMEVEGDPWGWDLESVDFGIWLSE
jgi:hypothetical protein